MSKWVTSGLLLLLGVTLALSVGALASAGAAEATYVGQTVCIGCHQVLNAVQIKGWQESPHSRALWKVDESDATRKVVADLAKAPFPKDQVAWILGSGARSQAYLDKDFKVLPNRWVVKGSSWQPQDAVDAKKDCLGCHTTGHSPGTATWVAEGVDSCGLEPCR
jgi:cytochrome c551/c552